LGNDGASHAKGKRVSPIGGQQSAALVISMSASVGICQEEVEKGFVERSWHTLRASLV
jgi:hypothetical protein